jgi:cell fate regulator YaaT (PSP1 superfamily)
MTGLGAPGRALWEIVLAFRRQRVLLDLVSFLVHMERQKDISVRKKDKRSYWLLRIEAYEVNHMDLPEKVGKVITERPADDHAIQQLNFESPDGLANPVGQRVLVQRLLPGILAFVSLLLTTGSKLR